MAFSASSKTEAALIFCSVIFVVSLKRRVFIRFLNDVRGREEEVSTQHRAGVQHYATIRIVAVECESSPIFYDVLPILVAVYVVQTAAFLERCGGGFNLDRFNTEKMAPTDENR